MGTGCYNSGSMGGKGGGGGGGGAISGLHGNTQGGGALAQDSTTPHPLIVPTLES